MATLSLFPTYILESLPTCDFRSVDLVLPSDHSIPSKGMNERFNEKDKIVIKGRGNFLPCRGSIAGLARKPIYPLFWKILESCSSTSFVSITYARLLVAASNRPLLIDRVFHPRFPANNPSAESTRRRRGSFISSRGPCNTFFFYGCARRKEKSGGGWNLLVRDGARFLCEVHSWQKRRSI